MCPEDENEINDSLLNGDENGEYTELEAGSLQQTIHLSGMYQNWFLDYASYVILERAVPDVKDGLKPVHRRILHAMDELDDGRYNKVANIIGHTMKYHPHGDASIGDALVQLGQKEILIDMQGNWGNIHTGDSAAAPRYIEARLSKFANEVVFNPKTTEWKLSYDGRNKEPVALPVKFPLLLAQGVEGIAVGLSSKILSHNFNELIDASINILEKKEFEILPDFLTGGLMDATKYNYGQRGGKVRLRAKISQIDKKTLLISEIPFGTTTSSLIETIITANDKGKIKIRKIDDNTSQNVEILVHLMPGVSPDTTMDALYAFTDCEISISPNCCVIHDGKPRFISVNEVLEISTQNTVDLLQQELLIRKAELEENWHFSSLEKIFIENRIYRDIEECETWEAVIENIDLGLTPFKPLFRREITTDDIVRLTEIKIKRISKFDSFKADELIKNIEDEIDEVNNHLDNLIDFVINYFKQIKKKYGKNRDRRTEIRNFENIEATMVAAANQKLYVNRAEGFIGIGLKKDEFVCDCSDIDDIITFRSDGTFKVTKVEDKVFVGENILHVDIFKKNDERTIYNMIYQDGVQGNIMVKRFAVLGVTRDKEYVLTKGTKGSRVLYFTANPNGEAEIVKVDLKPKPKLKKLTFEFSFSSIEIKGRSSMGNILTRNAVRRIELKDAGVSTLAARDIWFDDTVLRLNSDGRGKHLGAFEGNDKIITFADKAYMRFYNFDLNAHFDEDMRIIEKFNPSKPYSFVYKDTKASKYFVKRFLPEPSDKKLDVVGIETGSELICITSDYLPRIEVDYLFGKTQEKKSEIINLFDFVEIMNQKARGKRIPFDSIQKVTLIDALPYDEPKEEEPEVEEMESDIVEPSDEPVSFSINPKLIVDEDDQNQIKPINPKDIQQMTLDFL
ncbi:MAG: DNA gyrase/topoisomerase IV subunit A [Bacteroidota bacterium]